MGERQALGNQLHSLDPQMQSPVPPREDMIACAMALEAALLPCLPDRELLPIDPSHQNKSASGVSTSKSSSFVRSIVSNAEFDVEKFDGTNNFGMWQCEVLDVLCQQELEFALEDKPVDLDDTEWARINRQACATIRFCLSREQKYFVMKETSAKELWRKLEDKYMSKSIENRLNLKKKLFRFDYKQSSSMIEHLNTFNKMLFDLQNLDVEIKDEEKAILLLNSLPDSFDHLSTTLLYGRSETKFEDVSNALINNEYWKKDQIVHQNSTSEALTVKGRAEDIKGGKQRRQSRLKSRGASSSGRGRPAKDECHYCRKQGHWKKDCPMLKDKDKKVSNVTS